MNTLRVRRPGAAFVVSVIALIVALGGTSYAAFTLARNSVGAKQLRNGAVTTQKLKNRAVTARKMNLAGVTVPNATHASTAGAANKADSANSAGFAGVAANLTAPESFHNVGAAGEPVFQHSWANKGGAVEPARFFKDREGVVHLEGVVQGGTGGAIMFQLPAGYRPASGKLLLFAVMCGCEEPDPQGSTQAIPSGTLQVLGSGVGASNDGRVNISTQLSPAGYVSLDGVTFRAES